MCSMERVSQDPPLGGGGRTEGPSTSRGGMPGPRATVAVRSSLELSPWTSRRPGKEQLLKAEAAGLGKDLELAKKPCEGQDS